MKPTRSRSVRAYRFSAHILASIGLCAALAACTAGSGQGVSTNAAQLQPPRAQKGDLGIGWLFRKKPRIAPADPAMAVASGFEVVEEADPTVAAVPDRAVLEAQAEMIRGGGRYHVGKPYEIAGKRYEPRENPSYDREGMASWYGRRFHGRLTANGEIFDRTAITAAHPTMPLPSYVRVTNLNNDRSIIVRVNDRGPFRDSRLIDVSEQTAAVLGFRRNGLTQVRVQYVSKAPLEGEDKAWLLATYQGPPTDRPRVLLASGGPAAKPAAASAISFAPPPSPRPAADAMERLTATMPASDRIVMAFRAAEEVRE